MGKEDNDCATLNDTDVDQIKAEVKKKELFRWRRLLAKKIGRCNLPKGTLILLVAAVSWDGFSDLQRIVVGNARKRHLSQSPKFAMLRIFF